MKIVEIINRIGCVMLAPGMILLFWNLGRFAQGTEAENTLTWVILGGILTVLGLIMGNFKSEWLFEE